VETRLTSPAIPRVCAEFNNYGTKLSPNGCKTDLVSCPEVGATFSPSTKPKIAAAHNRLRAQAQGFQGCLEGGCSYQRFNEKGGADFVVREPVSFRRQSKIKFNQSGFDAKDSMSIGWFG